MYECPRNCSRPKCDRATISRCEARQIKTAVAAVMTASVRGGASWLLPPVSIFRIFVLMKGVVVTAKSPTEYKFLIDLLKKLGLSSAPVSEEELEDLALSKM